MKPFIEPVIETAEDNQERKNRIAVIDDKILKRVKTTKLSWYIEEVRECK